MKRYLYAVLFFPLIHNVALCCSCMMTVLLLWHRLISINSRCIYSDMQMFSKRDGAAAGHPLCLVCLFGFFGKIDHFCNFVLNLSAYLSFLKTVDLYQLCKFS